MQASGLMWHGLKVLAQRDTLTGHTHKTKSHLRDIAPKPPTITYALCATTSATMNPSISSFDNLRIGLHGGNALMYFLNLFAYRSPFVFTSFLRIDFFKQSRVNIF
jgi:hypothetical protein